MRFGPVPPAQALGSILAHSLELNGTKLRKGLILKQDHLDMMAAADLDHVVVAQLDADDLHEDAAASRLAHALVPADTTLRLTEAFTGRVNLLAPGPGVALINEDKLNAANDVNPMITVATVPAYQQMSQRGMVATVKIIAYGVPAADLEIACDRARAAISFAPSKLRTTTLIVTEIPGGAGEKGVQAIRDRLTLLGVSLSEVVVVPHAEAPLGNALASAQTDLTLILTGSATSDPMDVAPQSVRLAGGQVERFGMPVDPGNLLFVGSLNDRPVIGLPGCARSPALNGADWVLSRIVCGLNVSHSDIARMGVGGLLKEIPTRPMPRQGRRGKAAES
jgi:molybdenum cofactor cytidylyltransferase